MHTEIKQNIISEVKKQKFETLDESPTRKTIWSSKNVRGILQQKEKGNGRKLNEEGETKKEKRKRRSRS